MDSSDLKKNDYVWWGIACLTGGVLWSLPFLLSSIKEKEGTVVPVLIVLLIISGAAIGYIRPQRPWRWALASILLLPFIGFIEVAKISSSEAGSFSLKAALLYTVITVPVNFIQGLPMLAGAYLGAYLKKRRAPGVNETATETSGVIVNENKLRWAGFMLGFLGGIMCCIGLSNAEPSIFANLLFYMSFIMLFLPAFGISFLRPERVWRWALAVQIGFVGAVFCRIIIDSMQDPSSHDMFPFEIILSLIIAAPFTFAGAYVGLQSNLSFARKGKKVPAMEFGRPVIIVSLLLIVGAFLYMIITSKPGPPLEAGITLGKDTFGKTVLVSEPTIGDVTSIKVLPDAMLLVAGDRGAIIIDAKGKIKSLVKFDDRLGKVEPVSVGSAGEFEYVNRGGGWQPVSLIGSNGKIVWKSSPKETPDEMAVIDLDADGVLEFVVGMSAKGGLKAFDRTGKELWMQPASNVFSVSTISVEGATNILHSDGNNIVVRSVKGEKLRTMTLPFISFEVGRWPGIEQSVIIGTEGASVKAFDFSGKLVGSLPILRSGRDVAATPVLFNGQNGTTNAVVVSLRASWHLSELYLFDQRDTLVYHEIFRGMDPAVATSPARNGGGESLLVGGMDGTVTEYKFRRKDSL